MKQKMALIVAAIIWQLGTAGNAQTLAINSDINIALLCRVQQDAPPNASTTNLQVNTQSLLESIATDQGFTLPAHAKLWLENNIFYIHNDDKTIFKYIDTNILNITYGTSVLKSKQVQTQRYYSENVKGTSVAAITYNGTTLSFSLSFVGENDFINVVNFDKSTNNAVASSSFSGLGFGSGQCGGQSMVVTGSLTGKNSFQYTAGGNGGTLPSGTGSGAFPGSGVGAYPH